MGGSAEHRCPAWACFKAGLQGPGCAQSVRQDSQPGPRNEPGVWGVGAGAAIRDREAERTEAQG